MTRVRVRRAAGTAIDRELSYLNPILSTIVEQLARVHGDEDHEMFQRVGVVYNVAMLRKLELIGLLEDGEVCGRSVAS